MAKINNAITILIIDRSDGHSVALKVIKIDLYIRKFHIDRYTTYNPVYKLYKISGHVIVFFKHN